MNPYIYENQRWYRDNVLRCTFTEDYESPVLLYESARTLDLWLDRWQITEYAGTIIDAWHEAEEWAEWEEKNGVDLVYMQRVSATGYVVATAQAAALFGEGG